MFDMPAVPAKVTPWTKNQKRQSRTPFRTKRQIRLSHWAAKPAPICLKINCPKSVQKELMHDGAEPLGPPMRAFYR